MFHDGRWQWTTNGWLGSATRICGRNGYAAGTRYPAGIVKLTGGFVSKHRKELVHLARNNELIENRDHPLNRIIKIEEHPDSIVITTTDIHLPRRIAEAVRHAYKGDLDLRYDEEGYFARAEWRRES
jgi:hypothetical protein